MWAFVRPSRLTGRVERIVAATRGVAADAMEDPTEAEVLVEVWSGDGTLIGRGRRSP